MLPLSGCTSSEEKNSNCSNNDERSTEQLNNPLETGSASQSIISTVPRLHHELAIIFDIDGTLIAEGPKFFGRFPYIRPGASALLRWLLARNHKLALWTMGNQLHVERVLDELELREEDFVFIWAAAGKERYIRKQQQPHIICQNQGHNNSHTAATPSQYCCCLWWETIKPGDTHARSSRECQWCGVYRKVCQRCQCHLGTKHDNHRLCPCRSVKDLRKIWHSTDESIRSIFFQHNTLIVENTPQQCVFNLDNMILVPSYTGETTNEEELCLLTSLQEWIEHDLETAADVRKVQKCDCSAKSGEEMPHHACLEQTWWPTTGRP